jgi:hypothetical protein
MHAERAGPYRAAMDDANTNLFRGTIDDQEIRTARSRGENSRGGFSERDDGFAARRLIEMEFGSRFVVYSRIPRRYFGIGADGGSLP